MRTSNPEQCGNTITQYFNDSEVLDRGEFLKFADTSVAAGSRVDMINMIYQAKQGLEASCQTDTDTVADTSCNQDSCDHISMLKTSLDNYNKDNSKLPSLLTDIKIAIQNVENDCGC